MRAINEVVGQALVWVQPSLLRQTYELHASDEVVATLQFERRSSASGETAWQTWTFERAGFLSPRVTIQIRDSGETAIFKLAAGGGGVLDLSNGRQLRFGAANFWRTRWYWSDPATEATLMEFKIRKGGIKNESRLEIEMTAIADSALPLLVVLGWYLLVLSSRGAATVAAGR